MQEGRKLSDPSLLSLLIADSLGNHFSCVCVFCVVGGKDYLCLLDHTYGHGK